MQKVLSVIGKSIELQKAVFDSLELNPYDNYEDTVPEFNFLISSEEIEETIEEIKIDLSYFTDFSEERIHQIENGSILTNEEEQTLRTAAVEILISHDDVPMSVIAKLTDGNKLILALYIEALQGQGGLHITGFNGFYETDEEALKALNSQEDLIVFY